MTKEAFRSKEDTVIRVKELKDDVKFKEAVDFIVDDKAWQDVNVNFIVNLQGLYFNELTEVYSQMLVALHIGSAIISGDKYGCHLDMSELFKFVVEHFLQIEDCAERVIKKLNCFPTGSGEQVIETKGNNTIN